MLEKCVDAMDAIIDHNASVLKVAQTMERHVLHVKVIPWTLMMGGEMHESEEEEGGKKYARIEMQANLHHAQEPIFESNHHVININGLVLQ